ncbi:class I SAM-dependent methyltransferase [Microbacterium galbinum]|uniref:Methyltransferase domain-containing protein n=1 Tax=Microbacterium galbinum TaxID=2851646 RepID=A0ABY4IPJ9_9MICO|nr:class I SAM-dependent methyltransferase [Microbacterium galbinum]UPL13213.1 methyltransferase domain-containing protein [Microbacterium galbinum]
MSDAVASEAVTSDSVIAAAYSARAEEYVRVLGDIEQLDAADRATIAAWRDSTTGTLLDAGSGPGMWTRFLGGGTRDEGGRDVWGLDVTEAFVASARARFPETTFAVGSFREIPAADASLGGILAWYSLIHTPPAEVPAVLAEFARVLRPGGSLLLGYFDGTAREEFGHRVTTAYFWSAEALGALLVDAGFTVVSAERRDRRPGEASSRPHGALTAVRCDPPGTLA